MLLKADRKYNQDRSNAALIAVSGDRDSYIGGTSDFPNKDVIFQSNISVTKPFIQAGKKRYRNMKQPRIPLLLENNKR